MMTPEQQTAQHLHALHCPVYEVGVFDRERMLLRTWDRESLDGSRKWLAAQNAQGRDIYVRPHGEHRYSLVDDLTRDALQDMRRDGFQPAVVIETSPNNYQAWLNHGQILPQAVSTAAARELAERYGGDKGAADWRHFGRLSGFTNRKPKHQQADGRYPWCNLHEHSGRVYDQAHAFVPEMRKRLEQEQKRLTAERQRQLQPNGNLLGIEHFRSRQPDGHRADFQYAMYASQRGVPDYEIRAAIFTRDLSKHGTSAQQERWVDTTIMKARKGLGLGL
jgi:hypothetical protein